MKKISHCDEYGIIKPSLDRYYYGDDLLLEVDNATMGHRVLERVEIGGATYIIKMVMHFPEILAVNYYLEVI